MKSEIIYIFSLIIVFIFSCNRVNKQKKPDPSVNQVVDTLQEKAETKIKERQSFDILIEEYESPERGTWQNPELVLGKLGDLEGKTIADIGCGTGYFTFPLGRTADKVIAIDIEPQFLEFIEESKLDLSPEMSEVIETRLTDANNPNLADNEADAILMVNVFYYLENRPAYMAKVKKGLKENGVLVLVDFKVGDMPVGPADNKISSDQALTDIKNAGFKVLEVDLASLQYQYIITAN